MGNVLQEQKTIMIDFQENNFAADDKQDNVSLKHFQLLQSKSRFTAPARLRRDEC